MPSQPEPLDNRRRNSFDVLRRSAGPSALAALLAVSSVGPSLAKTVHDLDSVPDALRTPFGKEVWRDQMEGKPVADGLGTALPDGLTAEALVNLLAPNRGETPVSGVGAKPWPSQPGRFVAVVCTGGSVPAKPDDDKCSADHRGAGKAPLVAHVGVVERGPDGALRLVGGAVAVDGRLSWRDSGLPAQPEDPDDRDGTGDDSKLAPSVNRR